MNKLPDIEFLLQLTDFGIKLGLEKTTNLLEKFDNPHLRYKSVLVAGTNGKGSVSKTLAHILGEAGYNVGLYTSPHLVDLRERIVCNDLPVPLHELIVKIRQLRDIIEQEPVHMQPTFFEAITVIAFSYFADRNIDILVCEVGMGGRFDATNVLPACLQVITGIGLEHTQFLGKTYPEIANEKAGIIKQKSLVVSAEQQSEAMKVIKDKARESGSKLYVYGKDFHARRTGYDINYQKFNFYGTDEYRGISTPLKGKHQVKNMSLVLQALTLLKGKGFPVKAKEIYSSMSTVKWPCRFDIIKKNPWLILDGAHNPDAVAVLLSALKEIFPGERFSFLIGILKDKNWKNMLQKTLKYKNLEEIVFTAPDSERALSPETLFSFCKDRSAKKISVIPSAPKAYAYTQKKGGNWCIFGSLHFCGDVLPLAGAKKDGRNF